MGSVHRSFPFAPASHISWDFLLKNGFPRGPLVFCWFCVTSWTHQTCREGTIQMEESEHRDGAAVWKNGLSKGKSTPKIAGYKVQETLHFRYLKFLLMKPLSSRFFHQETKHAFRKRPNGNLRRVSKDWGNFGRLINMNKIQKSLWKFYIGVSKNRGTPKWMVKIMENPVKMDDLGVPLFLETPI